jgi:hypothetical protein
MSDATTQGGGPEGATAVKDQASEAASTAVARTGEVAGAATEGARQVASEASRQAGELTTEALTSARNLVGEATGSLRDQAGQQTERAASGLRSLSDQVRALAEGRTDEAGAAGDYARQAGEKLQQVADRLEEGGLEGALSDLQGFARRRPGVFLLGCAAAGFAVGRLVRGAQAANQNGGGNGSGEIGNGSAQRLGRADGPLTTSSSLGPAPASVVGGDVATGLADVAGTGPSAMPPPGPGVS